MWAITSFYNPMHSHRRLDNFRIFRRFLNVPLVAVELAYGDFELTSEDADILIQISGHDVMWQKERLLNVALSHVPQHCKHVAWLDADIIFHCDDWMDQASRLLDENALVQLYESPFDLPIDFDPNEEDWRSIRYPDIGRSCVSLYQEESSRTRFDSPDYILHAGPTSGIRHGLAWACHAEILRKHLFYDVCILGSGDRALQSAAYRRYEWAIGRLQMNEAWADHYRRWAEPFADAISDRIAYLPGTLYHLWHGTQENRRLQDRHSIGRKYGFNPEQDLALDQNGSWRWNSKKAAFHREVVNFFRGRQEDGILIEAR